MEEYVTKQEFISFKNEITKQTHNGYDGGIIDFNTLLGFFKTVTSSTELSQITDITQRVPSAVSEQIFIDTSTATKKLYIYDFIGKVWRSVTIA